jgi:hypothetical protein
VGFNGLNPQSTQSTNPFLIYTFYDNLGITSPVDQDITKLVFTAVADTITQVSVQP